MNGFALIHLKVDGQAIEVPAGSSVAAAIAQLTPYFRRSCGDQRRAPLCGMGVCFECRVAIDGVTQLRACMIPAREGMRVRTCE
jgi:predicted molibdopterin-dependent oxidoreductase YjgC